MRCTASAVAFSLTSEKCRHQGCDPQLQASYALNLALAAIESQLRDLCCPFFADQHVISILANKSLPGRNPSSATNRKFLAFPPCNATAFSATALEMAQPDE